jgi:hypothetical protein
MIPIGQGKRDDSHQFRTEIRGAYTQPDMSCVNFTEIIVDAELNYVKGSGHAVLNGLQCENSF